MQDFIDALNRISASVVGGNGLDAIKSAFIAPYWLLKNGSSWVIPESIEPRQVFTSITPLSSLNGYTPKNKKLLTYPYCYMLVSNFQGESKILKQEFWKKLEHDVTTQDGYSTLLPAGDMVLQIWGALTEGCSIVAIPENYAGDEIASNMGVTLGKFPQINWNSDSYTNWLTQNGVTGYTGAIAQTALGVATENPIFIGQGIGTGLTTMMSGVQASQLPPQNNGTISNGDIMLSMDENCFHILKMSITSQYAQKIDDYFTKYGYRVNALKIPNMTGRAIFNYIKIANDEDFAWGNLDAKSLEKINNIARNGVTIWHNHANIGNYSLQNT